jgi:BirA family biotin operon repressor/biotin-[acetyl-CoA-carboxylase] ligase
VLTPLGFSLLRQLSDGAFHSGEDLAATVGLTRARVSQLLKQAETAGLSLERVRGRGYRCSPPPIFSTPPPYGRR